MKMFKKSIAVLCAALMMVSAFASCGGNNDAEKETAETTVVTEETIVETAVETTSETVAETNEETKSPQVTTKAVENVGYASEYGTYSAVNPETGIEVTMTVSGDKTFELVTSGNDFETVQTGMYKYGVTNSASIIKMEMYLHKTVTTANGETTEEDGDGTEPFVANIEGETLTLTMDGADTVLTKN